MPFLQEFSYIFQVVGPDKEAANCAFGPHPWVAANVIQRGVKDYALLTVCVNKQRRYLAKGSKNYSQKTLARFENRFSGRF